MAEFVTQPRRLMQGDAVMKALNPQDTRYEAGTGAIDISGDTFDVFESNERAGLRLSNCVRCHENATTLGLRTARVRFLKEDTPEAIIKMTSARKRRDKTWKALRELWRSES